MAKAKKQEKATGGAAAGAASEASEAPASKSRSTKGAAAKAESKGAGTASAAKPSTRAAGKKGARSEKADKGAAGGAPLIPAIDTNLAAAAAASMVANRAALGGAATGAAHGDAANPNAPKQESSAFKALKQGLNKPAGTGGVGGLLGTPPGQKKSNLPFGGQQQNFRNQTFGADVNRSGVPRRTSG